MPEENSFYGSYSLKFRNVERKWNLKSHFKLKTQLEKRGRD